MGVYDNSPTKSYIRMTGIIVKYNDKLYNVEDFYTMKKYIYWDADNPYILQADNLLPKKSLVRFLVMINDKGMNQPVENHVDNFHISFDGNSIENIKTNIIGMHGDIDGLGDRTSSIEVDVGKIKTTVGELKEEDGKISDSITQITQTANDIKLDLQKTQKEFSNNKELVLLRERINKAFIDLNASLGIAKGDFTDFFHDEMITEVEKTKIITHIEVLRNKEAKLYLELDSVIAMLEEQGNTQKLTSLKFAKELLQNSMKDLDEITRTVISDEVIVPSEEITVVSLFGKVNFAIEQLKNTVDDIVFLGSGGMLTEWVGNIIYSVDGVKESFKQTITNMKKQVRLLKDEFKTQINDVLTALKTYQNYVNEYFADGKIDEAEKIGLQDKEKKLTIEKNDITLQFDKYKNDPMISDSTHKIIEEKYNDYISKHDALIKEVHSVIEDNMIDDIDKNKVNTKFTEYETSVKNFETEMYKALDELDLNKYNEEIKKAQEELSREINDVEEKRKKLESDMNTTFKDNVIDETERENIKRDMELINKEKTDVDNQYNFYSASAFLKGTAKEKFTNSYNSYIESYNELKTFVDGLLAKQELVTNQDKESLEQLKQNLFNKLDLFSTSAKEAIKSINDAEADKLKQDLGGEVGDVTTSISGLKLWINTAFKDGVLDEVELKNINEKLQLIEKEKKEVDVIYEELYNNPDLE